MRATCVLLIALVVGCDDPNSTGNELENREAEYRAKFDATPITLRGVVRSTDGAPVVGATVEVQGRIGQTNVNGAYVIHDLARRTSFVNVTAQDFRTEHVPAWLHRPLDMADLRLQPLLVVRRDAADARLLFGGDVSLGRRFLSADPPISRLPDEDPEALIQLSRADETTRDVLAAIKPYLDDADFTSVNLETVVTDEPDTPFDSKPYIFYTLPGSLNALQWLGVDYVALANNHIYDYLEKGVSDTLLHVRAAGMPFSGAGLTLDDAFEPHRVSLGETDFSMVSLISFSGSQYPTLWVANQGKGGAAYAWDRELVEGLLQQERDAGRVPVVNLHTGREYAELPTDEARERMLYLSEHGAALVIAHHPHVPQGLEWDGDTLIAHSLGNLVFDQERLETVLGLALYVDMRGDTVISARGVPIWLEDFRPRPIAGPLADVLLRRIAQGSAKFGTETVIHNGQLWILPPDVLPQIEDSSVQIDLAIGPDGVGYFDLREVAESRQSIVAIESDGLSGRLGRDIMLFGEVEDFDVDEDLLETATWYTTGVSSYPCLHERHRGAAALCSFREDAVSTSVINFRSRVRVLGNALDMPNKDLTLLAWLQGENAGRVTIDIGYFAPLGVKEFGSERAYDGVLGSTSWQPHWYDLSMPPDAAGNEPPASRTDNARALRIFVEHYGPRDGPGMARFDDFAVISWSSETVFADRGEFESVHPYDYLRVEGPPGRHTASLTLRTHGLPAVAPTD